MNELRVLRMPNSTSIYVFVPDRPERRPEDLQRDFPRHEPPEVHRFGLVSNYWVVLEEIASGVSVMDQETRDWLQSVEPQVRAMLLD